MKILIKYRQRLSEIIRILPIAQHLANQKHEVFIETHPAFQSILRLVDYAKYAEESAGGWDLILPLAISPAHSHEYRTRNPAPKFFEFVTGLFPKDLKGVSTQIRFTQMPGLEEMRVKYRLPAQFSIACPLPFSFAYSRGFGDLAPIELFVFENWLQQIKPRGETYYLLPEGFHPNRRHITVTDLAEAATLIHHAADFASICCAGAAIAAALIGKKKIREEWHYVVPQHTREREQDDIFSKDQVRWAVSQAGSAPVITRLNAR